MFIEKYQLTSLICTVDYRWGHETYVVSEP